MSYDFEGIPDGPRDFSFDPEPEIFGETVGRDNFELWRKLQLKLNILQLSLQDIHVIIRGGLLALAYQEITITDDDLAETTVADDTLITVSGTPIKFKWSDPRLLFARTVNLEPATGVEPMGFVMDTGVHINPAVLHSVDDAGAVTHNLQMDCVTPVPDQHTYLQRRQWVNTDGVWDLDAVAWEVGQTLHLSQIRIIEATVLEL